MKLRIPKHAEHGKVLIEILGPDVHRRIEALTCVDEIERHFEVDERLLSATGCFLDNGNKQVGETFMLKEAEIVESAPEPDPEPEEIDEEEDPEDEDEEEPVEEAEPPRRRSFSR